MQAMLNPHDTGRFIMEGTNILSLNDAAARRIAQLIVNDAKDGTLQQVNFDAHPLHPKCGGKKAVDWAFFMDTINFSFWPDEGKKYDVTYNGVKYTGYFAGCAALNKKLDSGVDATNAEWMANVKMEELDEMFKGDSGHSIPMLQDRLLVINEAGRMLIEKWEGSFYNAVLAAGGKAMKLLDIIVQDFPSYRDYAAFDNKKLSFLKRAQILVADVYGALKAADGKGCFDDIAGLSMFADYRVPQALASLGVLEYAPELMARLKDGRLMHNGSTEEMVLRGASIYACNVIVREIDQIMKRFNYKFAPITAMEVDMWLWVYRRKHAEEVDAKVPFHRTRCIYY